ncbi:MAG TPA: hypothetical protein VFD33_05805 [Bacillota bacterium]|nr:hypothetical protein [Bacillota bacterium]
MASNYFHRSFVMLRTKDKGFNHLSGKEPSGYCKLETRKNFGRIQVYIQDLKAVDPGKGTYDLILVSDSSSIPPLKLLAIWPEEDGKFERAISFNPYNVEDSNYGIESFQGIGVVFRQRDGGMAMGFPLVGYRDKYISFDWEGNIRDQLASLHKDKQQVGLEESLNEGHQEDQPTPEPAHEEPAHKEPAHEGTQLGDDLLSIWEEVEEQELSDSEIDYPNDFDQEPLAIDGDSNESQYDDEIDDDTYKEAYKPEVEDMTYWGKVKEYFEGLFDRHRRLCPFDTVGEEDWVRIEHRDDPASSYFKRPGGMYGLDMNSIDHYLVGLRREEGRVQYVIYAIPGVYTAVPPMSIHGLSKWLPVRGGYGTGYWLLYIDAKTGEIAYPD